VTWLAISRRAVAVRFTRILFLLYAFVPLVVLVLLTWAACSEYP
jgi:hypothetical protein